MAFINLGKLTCVPNRKWSNSCMIPPYGSLRSMLILDDLPLYYDLIMSWWGLCEVAIAVSSHSGLGSPWWTCLPAGARVLDSGVTPKTQGKTPENKGRLDTPQEDVPKQQGKQINIITIITIITIINHQSSSIINHQSSSSIIIIIIIIFIYIYICWYSVYI